MPTKKKTHEQVVRDIETGKKDADIYTGAGRQALEEGEDEISEVEEGFMEGYEDEEAMAECGHCGKVLVGSDIVELDLSHKIHRFCSAVCAEKFQKKHQKKK